MSLQKITESDIRKLSLPGKLRILSLDVVLGALAGASAAFIIFEVKTGIVYWLILPVVVFIVYTMDHMIDGLKLKNEAFTLRHYYHYLNSRPLGIILVLLIAIAFISALIFLQKEIILFGIIGGLIISMYLAIIEFFKRKRNNFLFKELIIAIIYTYGIWGCPIFLTGFRLNTAQAFLLVSFIILAWINLLVISIKRTL